MFLHGDFIKHDTARPFKEELCRNSFLAIKIGVIFDWLTIFGHNHQVFLINVKFRNM